MPNPLPPIPPPMPPKPPAPAKPENNMEPKKPPSTAVPRPRMKPPDCGIIEPDWRACCAGMASCLCGEVGFAARLGAWELREPRKPPERPPPARASAKVSRATWVSATSAKRPTAMTNDLRLVIDIGLLPPKEFILNAGSLTMGRNRVNDLFLINTRPQSPAKNTYPRPFPLPFSPLCGT